MLFKRKKKVLPDVYEFTDDDGKKWLQTSTKDLLSSKELNDIIKEIEKEKEEGEIVIARIDFKKVNKEYYERVVELEDTLKKRTDLLKRIIKESRETIDRKNKKLKELIEYIKKLHLILAYYKLSPEDFNKIDFTKAYAKPSEIPAPQPSIEIKEKVVEYVPVEEQIMQD
ncbi:MAG TPA: hypothetical protein PLH80_05035 [Spirochaetota bacterium]|nr:hypothetical protein [Spirochaetota bacterium]HOR94367.1 hypothetical protein [Spirochaetota bacterium]HOT19285.1 hypothetical protein [Spirochaetota bacterium]HPD04006.1 hypothetical protein [Spirochaetota bacterium]HQI37905.1 hypothetical protein [Spirochaetota bacterium]